MLQPMTTSGIKSQDDAGHLNASDHSRGESYPATMATTPKTFSPGRRTDLGYPRTTQLHGRLHAIGFSEHPNQHRSQRPVLLAVNQELGEGARIKARRHSIRETDSRCDRRCGYLPYPRGFSSLATSAGTPSRFATTAKRSFS